MKKIATILLLLFTLVQVGPAVGSLFADSTIVFLVDEEKADDKIESDKKEKKEIPFIAHQASSLRSQIITALHAAEKIEASPCLEKLIPPPNFC